MSRVTERGSFDAVVRAAVRASTRSASATRATSPISARRSRKAGSSVQHAPYSSASQRAEEPASVVEQHAGIGDRGTGRPSLRGQRRGQPIEERVVVKGQEDVVRRVAGSASER